MDDLTREELDGVKVLRSFELSFHNVSLGSLGGNKMNIVRPNHYGHFRAGREVLGIGKFADLGDHQIVLDDAGNEIRSSNEIGDEWRSRQMVHGFGLVALFHPPAAENRYTVGHGKGLIMIMGD